MGFKKRTALAASAVIAISASWSAAFAAPSITEAFLANVNPNVAFLAQSSKLALSVATSERLRKFASGEVVEVSQLADAIDMVTPPMVLADGLEGAPPATGRSVAIDGGINGLGQAANGRTPLGSVDIQSLAALSGRGFADAYWLKQVDALVQLRADYQQYAANGDDPVLVALARRELKTVNHRLELLSKL